MKINYVTEEGFGKLIKERERLDEEYTKTVKSMGELRQDDVNAQENPAYLGLLTKAMHEIPVKQQEINEKIFTARIIERTEEYQNWDGTTVSKKCRVHLLFDGELESFDILGSNESDLDNNIISCTAPLSEALFGKKKGESVKFNGVEVSIVKIERVELAQEKEENRTRARQR